MRCTRVLAAMFALLALLPVCVLVIKRPPTRRDECLAACRCRHMCENTSSRACSSGNAWRFSYRNLSLAVIFFTSSSQTGSALLVLPHMSRYGCRVVAYAVSLCAFSEAHKHTALCPVSSSVLCLSLSVILPSALSLHHLPFYMTCSRIDSALPLLSSFSLFFSPPLYSPSRPPILSAKGKP